LPRIGICPRAFGGYRRSVALTEITTMVIGLILFVAAAILIGTLLFRLAVNALPLCCAYLAAQAVHASGAGWVAAIAAAALAAIGTLAFAQTLIAFAGSPAARIAVGLAFALPAGFAGYHAMHGIAATLMPLSIWQHILPMITSVAIAAMAWMRIGAAPSERK
jgi:hypothetical protein